MKPLCLLVAACVWLSACSAHFTGYGAPSRYSAPGRYSLDSATAACQRNPALCVRSTETVPRVVSSTPVKVMAASVAATSAVRWKLDEALEREVRREVEQCANTARSAVLLRRGFIRPPTPAECNGQVVDARGNLIWDSQGNPMSLARQLGKEMHEEALQCIQERLSKMRPGKFSLEPRYRYDRNTKTTTFISPEEELIFLRQGGEQLKGTIKPDVVLHTGNPLEVQVVYDFKFPCVNTDNQRWFKKGGASPSQGALYEEALHAPVFFVLPWIGASP